MLHLRYPNAHTHWFSSLLLHLFLEVEDDRFREVMTKVLLERFIVHRPHPWGALVTFIELLHNTKYDFWSKDFIRVAPEVTLLLDSVSPAESLIEQQLTSARRWLDRFSNRRVLVLYLHCYLAHISSFLFCFIYGFPSHCTVL